VQAEEDEEEVEASESEKKVVEPEPKPEPGKRKQPQVRPWDIGKEGVKEGELLVLFSIFASPCCCIFLLSCYLPEIIYNDRVTYEGKSVNKSQKAMKKILSEIFT
jgi:hypothetical protein